ncbi:hypothetical protein [Nonomuraea lactucae]|uniref:hypothetical protein n=1 Tax=Nonomuraea lactucae TaxID=2249762 RepID=UPI000DE481AB|nr:hypothetical protein [Nonomuraea lactucae]
MIKRGWVVAGTLVVVGLPTAPATASRVTAEGAVTAGEVTAVLDRIDAPDRWAQRVGADGSDRRGQVVRTDGPDGRAQRVRAGDVLSFRVRLDGTGRDARLALAASPARALSWVACDPVPRAGDGAAGATEASRPVSSAALTFTALTAGTLEAAAPAPATAPSTTAPSTTAPPTTAPLATVQPAAAPLAPAARRPVGPDTSTAARAAGRGAFSVVSASSAAGPVPAAPESLAVQSAVSRALSAAQAAGSRASGSLKRAPVCELGDVRGWRDVDVRLRVPKGVREVVLAAVGRLREADGEGVTVLSRAAAMPVEGPEVMAAPVAPDRSRPRDAGEPRGTFVMEGRAKRLPSVTRGRGADPGPYGRGGGTTTDRHAGSASLDGRGSVRGAHGGQGSTQRDGGFAAVPGGHGPGHGQTVGAVGVHPRRPMGISPQLMGVPPQTMGVPPQAVGVPPQTVGVPPQAVGGPPQAYGGPPQVAGMPQQGLTFPNATPSALGQQAPAPLSVPSGNPQFPSSSTGEFGAPLPRQIAASGARPDQPHTVNFLAGARGLPWVAGGIAVLLVALWGVSRAQRARIRKKLL